MSDVQTKPVLIGKTQQSLREILQEMGQPAYRANQIYKWVHHHQVKSFDEMSNLPKTLRAELAEKFHLGNLTMATREVSTDGTIKYLWKTTGNHFMESVFIPEERRNTICISSQVGCALGCAFCATAKMGFLVNLTCSEIVEQVIRVQQDTGEKITNVVFMGMGEPFLNYSRVIQASHIFSDPEGLAIAAKKITISTVGVVPRIYQFTDESQPFSLAISLHASRQDLRQSIMPIADKFSLDQLMDSARYYTFNSKKRITFEYVLLEDINHSAKDAKGLISILSPLKCKLNLIPFNDTGLGFRTPSAEKIKPFYDILEGAPFTITLRKNRGNDISAACGQLYSKEKMTEKTPRFIKSRPTPIAT